MCTLHFAFYFFPAILALKVFSMDHSLPISLAAEPILHIGSFAVTNALLMSMLISVVFLLVLLFLPRNLAYVPKGLQNIVESLFELVNGVVRSIVSDEKVALAILPLVATFFLFILINNWAGLLPGVGSIGFYEMHEGAEVFVPLLRGANSDLNMTLALACVSVFTLQYMGFKFGGFAYLKKFFNFSGVIDAFIGLLELLSDIVKIFSFSFRLFGNVFAGEVLLIVIGAFVPYVAPIPFLGLELFAGGVQALVFSMLTIAFINMATSHEHH